jgi:hypothetical protein
MKESLRRAVLDAVGDHPEILQAAVTGSQARRAGIDRHSDLDLLLVARDAVAVRNVRAWFPQPERILICAFHLIHYCTLLLDNFEKIDLAIFPADDPSAGWVVHDYEVIKGDEAFGARLAQAAADTRARKAAHLNADASLNNALLLLTTAAHRTARGELLGAQAFLALAADMLVALERRHRGVEAGADLLDPRRRLERSRPALAQVLHACLFGPPDRGLERMARYLGEQYRATMDDAQRTVLERLLEHGPRA